MLKWSVELQNWRFIISFSINGTHHEILIKKNSWNRESQDRMVQPIQDRHQKII